MKDGLHTARQTFKYFIEACLGQQDMAKALSCVTEDVCSILTGVKEMGNNKAELAERLQQICRGASRHIQYLELTTKVAHDDVDLYAEIALSVEHLNTYFQISAVLTEIENTYRIRMIHLSEVSFQDLPEATSEQFGEKNLRQLKQEIRTEMTRLLSNAIEGGMIGVYLEPSFPVYFINNQMLKCLGYTFDEFMEENKGCILNGIHPEDCTYVESTKSLYYTPDHQYELKYRMRKQDGSFIWIQEKGKRMITEEDKVALISVCIDITESENLRQALEGQARTLAVKNKELAALTDNLPGGVRKCTVDDLSEFIYVSDGFIKMLGYSREEIEVQFQNSFYRMVYQDDLERIRREVVAQLESSHRIELEYRLQNNLSEIIWILDRAEVIEEDNRRYFYSVMTDVTEIKALNGMVESLTTNIPGGVCKIDLDEGFRLCCGNEGFYDLYGYTPAQMKSEMDNQILKMLPEEDATVTREVINKALTSEKTGVAFEQRITSRSGLSRWVLVKGKFAHDNNKTLLNCVMIDITERIEIEQALRINEERFRIALAQTDNTIFDYDINTKVMIHSEKAAEDYGLMSRTENVPESLVAMGLIHEESIANFREMYEQIIKGAPTAGCVIRVKLITGEFAWRKITMTSIFDSSGNPVRAVGVLEDLTREKELEQAHLKEEQYRNAMLFEAIAFCEINITQNTVNQVNIGLFGQFVEAEVSVYDKFVTLMSERGVWQEDKLKYKNKFNRKQLMSEFAEGNKEFKLEYRIAQADGVPMWVLKTVHLVEESITGDIAGFTCIKNIDEQKKQEIELRYQSERDALTGLYNKGTSENLIKNFLTNEAGDLNQALFVIDIDAFKGVNDNFGHFFGDKVLAESAQRICSYFRVEDIIGRIGGDEFIVFMKNIRNERLVKEKAREVCSAFHKKFQNGSKSAKVSCSIGIAFFPRDGMTFEELYQRADIALYQSKKQGKDKYLAYQEKMSSTQWVPYSSTAIDTVHQTISKV